MHFCAQELMLIVMIIDQFKVFFYYSRGMAHYLFHKVFKDKDVQDCEAVERMREVYESTSSVDGRRIR